MNIDAPTLLAIVAVINSLGAAAALIIHSIRVPYRESNASESIHLTEMGMKLRAAKEPPPGPVQPPAE